MASILFSITIIFYMLCMSPWPTFQSSSSDHQTLTCYIVQVEEPSSSGVLQYSHEDLNNYYNSFLPSVASSQRIIHSYRHALTGFAAMLSADESKDLANKEGVISVRPERILSLQTTRSPKFMGLNQNIGLWSDSNYGKGVIIGVLDTGTTPDHPSFSDHGMPPPPRKWKGKLCKFATTNTNFTCNNKIIGARSFVTEHHKTALDYVGHGTHTSSIAAGNFVNGANVFGNAKGTAAGIAPRAHLAIYKVCDAEEYCYNSATIAGVDAAIEDGVDVLSISIGGGGVDTFYEDILAIIAFRAMGKGIFVSFPAGNGGPDHLTLINGAPWTLTVGASTIDRQVRATVVLQGNSREFQGQTAFQPTATFPVVGEYLPLVYVKNCSDVPSLSMAHIKGKMVVCVYNFDSVKEGRAVKNAGGAAMIQVNYKDLGETTFADAHVLPAADVSYADGLKIQAYMNSTKRPMAKILFRGTVTGDSQAPAVAGFSSRGPNFQGRGILKPDIIGPGVNILAAWPVPVDTNTKPFTFNIQPGTSASCPHLSGVAALLKSAHPDWSPAAIKSAIMTTADVVNRAHSPIEDETFLPADIFATGAGHVNPEAATDPGLIYDIKPRDYVPYLCGLNYTKKQVRMFSKIRCSQVKSIPEAQLNYPSFALTFTGRAAKPQTYTRTVTNVGNPQSSYKLTFDSPPGIVVRVAPKELHFSKLNQKKQYNVTFSRNASSTLNGTTIQGVLKLCSSKQCVRSPIAVILK